MSSRSPFRGLVSSLADEPAARGSASADVRSEDNLVRLGAVAGDGDRLEPLRAYLKRILLPSECESVEPMAPKLDPRQVDDGTNPWITSWRTHRGTSPPTPVNLAVTALAKYGLGEPDRALEELKALRSRIEDPEWEADSMGVALKKEAESLLAGANPRK